MNSLITIGSVVAGGCVNMFFIVISGSVIPPPEGTDVTTMEGLIEAMPRMQPKHFLMPFIAHAAGTVAGAALVARFTSARGGFARAMFVGGFFFIGGATHVYMLPSPAWFNVTDLSIAYFPMAYLGFELSKHLK